VFDCGVNVTADIAHADAVTTRLSDTDVAELDCGLLSVAVIVNGYVPAGVAAQSVLIFTVEVPVFPPPEPVTGFVPNVSVVPAG